MKNCIVPALSVAFVALAAMPAHAQFQTWIRQFGTTSTERTAASAPDGSRGVYVAGWTQGSLGGPFNGIIDAWLGRYDNTGNQLWVRQLGTSGETWLHAASPDGSGGVYIGGDTTGNLGGPNAGNEDAWFAHYDDAGGRTWIRQLGTNGFDSVRAAATDGSGGVYVCGATDGSLGGPNAGSSDGWLARYDGTGNPIWLHQLGTIGGEDATAAAPDGSGGVFLTGNTTGSFGGPNAGSSDAWIARYDGSGNQIWIRQLGTTGSENASSASFDGSGGVFVAGGTNGSLGGPSAGLTDAWLAHYDGTGNQIWIKQLGSSGQDNLFAAAPDRSGGVYVSGFTDSNLGAPNAGGSDAWLAHYEGGGNRLWIRQLGTSGGDYAFAASPDGTGGVYVSGSTNGNLGGQNAGPEDTWLALYDGPCIPSSYCTAKINSLGCTPSISYSGMPSFTGSDDFYVTASNVLSSKPGIMLWGLTSGSIPFLGGTLCLSAPIIRTLGQNSGGTPAPAQDCSGAYSYHFTQSYMVAQLLPPSTRVYAQYWSRDPGFAAPNKVGLTNALSFLICP